MERKERWLTSPATCVDNDDAWLHPGKFGIGEALPRMHIERAMDVDNVRILKELVERDVFGTVLFCRIQSAYNRE